MKFKITFWKDIPSRTSVVDESNFKGEYFIGLDGLLYENYGTKDNPIWEAVFDADYDIEIIEEKP
jgi:hypothetical protein